MKRSAYRMLILTLCLYISCYTVLGYVSPVADCTPRTQDGPHGVEPFSAGCGSLVSPSAPELVTLYKTEVRTIAWPDGHVEQAKGSSRGECRLWYRNCHQNINLGFA